mmetsp:Transcript_7169/g.30544  ORF Transcript_7169/g.30544 Transcript_7169/m.30544 type:complete len:202 (-) Transcript_7169:1179-1784(-)
MNSRSLHRSARANGLAGKESREVAGAVPLGSGGGGGGVPTPLQGGSAALGLPSAGKPGAAGVREEALAVDDVSPEATHLARDEYLPNARGGEVAKDVRDCRHGQVVDGRELAAVELDVRLEEFLPVAFVEVVVVEVDDACPCVGAVLVLVEAWRADDGARRRALPPAALQISLVDVHIASRRPAEVEDEPLLVAAVTVVHL